VEWRVPLRPPRLSRDFLRSLAATNFVHSGGHAKPWHIPRRESHGHWAYNPSTSCNPWNNPTPTSFTSKSDGPLRTHGPEVTYLLAGLAAASLRRGPAWPDSEVCRCRSPHVVAIHQPLDTAKGCFRAGYQRTGISSAQIPPVIGPLFASARSGSIQRRKRWPGVHCS
jgi:hypothetical protein